MSNQLILRKVNSPYNDITKGSVLSADELDNNQIYLKGEVIYSAITQDGLTSLIKYNGETISFPSSSGNTGTTIFYSSITHSEMTTLISSSGLTEGVFYRISGCNTNLYGGTDIILQATSTTKLSDSGVGVFYNPNYGLYPTWSNMITLQINTQNGEFIANETLVANNGATGGVLGVPSINVMYLTGATGSWSGVTGITANTSNADATVGILSFPSYSVNDKVIWGGFVWKNKTGSVGSATDFLNLDGTNWDKVQYNLVDYIQETNKILYEVTHDNISYRENNLNKVRAPFIAIEAYAFPCNPIKAFPWGNAFLCDINCGKLSNMINTTRNILNLKMDINSSFNMINWGGEELGASIGNIELSAGASIDEIYLSSGATFGGITLGRGASITNISLATNTNCNGITIKDAVYPNYINDVSLYEGSKFGNIVLSEGFFNNGTSANSTFIDGIKVGLNSSAVELALNNGAFIQYVILGENSEFRDIDFGMNACISGITISDNTKFKNVKLNGGSTSDSDFSSNIISSTFGSDVILNNVTVGLNSTISNLVIGDSATIQNILLDGDSRIDGVELHSGSTLSYLTLGQGAVLRGLSANTNSLISYLNLGIGSEMSDCMIGELTGATFIYNNIGVGSNLNGLTMTDGRLLSYLDMGVGCSLLNVSISDSGELANFEIRDGIGVDTIEVKDSITDVIISSTVNNFPATINITSQTTMDLEPISYAGYITVISSNSGETINKISNMRNHEVKLIPSTGFTLNITTTPVASVTASNDIIAPVSGATLNGNKYDYATIKKNNGLNVQITNIINNI